MLVEAPTRRIHAPEITVAPQQVRVEKPGPFVPLRERPIFTLLAESPQPEAALRAQVTKIVDAGLDTPPQINHDTLVENIVNIAAAGARQPIGVIERVAGEFDKLKLNYRLKDIPEATDRLLEEVDSQPASEKRLKVAQRAAKIGVADTLASIDGEGPSAEEGEIIIMQASRFTKLATELFVTESLQESATLQEQTAIPQNVLDATENSTTITKPPWLDLALALDKVRRPPENQDALEGEARYAFTAGVPERIYELTHKKPLL